MKNITLKTAIVTIFVAWFCDDWVFGLMVGLMFALACDNWNARKARLAQEKFYRNTLGIYP